ncbi:MAG: hypothetical protein ABS93_02525 [Thiobacillus sp. SCN 62-729]|nr:MAG: hypothetical protein ABS93_02525 [Thiobacillus sp. SCN 62-729]
MAGVEFKGRQMWLDFKDAVGPALEAIADGVDKSRKWFKAWLKGFVRPVEVPAMQSVQMGLNFGAAVGFGSVVVNLRQRRA